MSSRSKSAICKSAIDISHLEREIRQDVAAYQQYKAEDGMKKRAVHISKDYDEFRNFVSVSQLKPTSGRDVSSLFNGASGSIAPGPSVRSRKIQGGQAAIGGFDDIIQRRKYASNPSTSVTMAKMDSNLQSLLIGKVPTDNSKAKAGTRTTKSSRKAYDFLREWKQHCTTAKDTLAFLVRTKDADGSFGNQLLLQPDAICEEYFSTDVDSEIVGDIVEALHLLVCAKKNDEIRIVNENGSTSNKNVEAGNRRESSGMPGVLSSESEILSFTHGWLKALPSCGRFELSICFLISDQQLKLKEICNSLKNSDNEAASDDYLLQYDTLLK